MSKTIPFYPGCTLVNKAKGLGDLAKASVRLFGLELKELDNWYCCQANFAGVSDTIMDHLACVRTLAAVREEAQEMVALCSTCYYALKRANHLMEQDEAKRKVAYEFIEKEYKGPVKVSHFLEWMRDRLGFQALKEKVKAELSQLRVAPYYGCQLLRPAKELAFDDLYGPTIFEDLLGALGCSVTDYAFKTECCGSYLITFSAEGVGDCVRRIVDHALKASSDVITTSCPLCNFNLEWAQEEIRKKDPAFKSLPVLYLTELMALALGVAIPASVWDEHVVDPRPFLKTKGLLS